MEVLKDRMYREIGKLFMETVRLRQALNDEQREVVRMTTELGSLRMRHKKLSATAIEQEENLVALNERLMGKKMGEANVKKKGLNNRPRKKACG